jgi:hypothetical protein
MDPHQGGGHIWTRESWLARQWNRVRAPMCLLYAAFRASEGRKARRGLILSREFGQLTVNIL